MARKEEAHRSAREREKKEKKKEGRSRQIQVHKEREVEFNRALRYWRQYRVRVLDSLVHISYNESTAYI